MKLLLAPILIYLVVPAIGVCVYLWLYRQMQNSAIQQPPYIALFILFCAYGGWVLSLLTMKFWEWSGLASLLGIGLVTITPIIMLVQAALLFEERNMSKYHYVSFAASIAYIGFIVILCAVMAVFVW
jgi:hypothetical protein